MHASAVEGLGMLRDEFQVCGLEIDLLGDEQRLHFQVPVGHGCLQPLVQDPLVERVLIDHLDPIPALDHDVAVVHLYGPLFGSLASPERRPRSPALGGERKRRLIVPLPRGHRSRRCVPLSRRGRPRVRLPKPGGECRGGCRLVPGRPGGGRSLQTGAHVRLEKCGPKRGQDEPIESGRLAEPHFDLGRMHVDVDHVGWHAER